MNSAILLPGDARKQHYRLLSEIQGREQSQLSETSNRSNTYIKRLVQHTQAQNPQMKQEKRLVVERMVLAAVVIGFREAPTWEELRETRASGDGKTAGQVQPKEAAQGTAKYAIRLLVHLSNRHTIAEFRHSLRTSPVLWPPPFRNNRQPKLLAYCLCP